VLTNCSRARRRLTKDSAQPQMRFEVWPGEVWYGTPGSHEWKVWRHSLAELLPKLFQWRPEDVLPFQRHDLLQFERSLLRR
jgi:hypothetical protein